VSQEIELIDSSGKLFTGKVAPSKVCVKCLLCDSVLETYMSLAYDHYPYVCDECKEAIAYAKELKKRNSCRL
jgi:hypothetical protein